MRTTALFQFLLAAFAAIALVACDKDDTDVPQSDSVIIGSQEWMRFNLDVDTFRNGDPILEAGSAEEWKRAYEEGIPAWCYYENDSTNGELYGRMYNLHAIEDFRGLAPEGWHIATTEEWEKMINHLGGYAVAGDKLKSTNLWLEGPGSNSSGFSALPGGSRIRDGGYNLSAGNGIAFYSRDLWAYFLTWNSDGIFVDTSLGYGAYVRCIR